ncbi:MAG: ornithine cyclodeaminase family protein [Pseudomonadota bacterium]
MVRVVALDEIRSLVDLPRARQAIAEGFIAYSRGDALVPEVGELAFTNPPGEAHVKMGYITGDPVFVIKIATGFYHNAHHNLPTQDGALLVHRRETGELACILLDRGWLTDLRTALAGALVAERLAPSRVDRIGVIGTGTQARLQVTCLPDMVSCRNLKVWAHSTSGADRYSKEMAAQGYRVQIVTGQPEFADCQLVITTTPAASPLLHTVEPGTHVTCVGTDSPTKNEVSPAVFARADLVVADSLTQCLTRGDLRHAIAAGVLTAADVVELGSLLDGDIRRDNDTDITVADLTGLAVQDVRMASHVMSELNKEES